MSSFGLARILSGLAYFWSNAIMKKTLAALAVLGAFAAGSAYAADVTLYGVVDLGLKYTHEDSDKPHTDATDKLEMKSGGQSGSRFGLKGVEDLGNGLKVGFVLENGFNADDGSLGNDGRLFGRESQAYIAGRFGELSFGRVGQLTSGNGTYGITGNLSPFGTSWSDAVEGSTYMVGYGRFDNTITYKSPNFAGFNVYAQYSFDANTKDAWDKNEHGADYTGHTEGKSDSTRYGALGVTYGNGQLNLVFTADWYNWSNNWNHYKDEAPSDLDDGYAFTLGGSYDFQVVKTYLGFQYFDNMLRISSDGTSEEIAFAAVGAGCGDFIKGYSVMAGVDAPIWGGTGMLAVGYADTEAADSGYDGDEEAKPESKRWGASVGYTYPLSKRTNVYGVAAYYQDKIENEAGDKGVDRDPSKAVLFLGMRHKF